MTAAPKTLAKGEEALLSAIDPTLRRISLVAGWIAPEKHEGYAVDIDLSVFLLRQDGLVRRDTDFVFYNNLETESGNVKHSGAITDEGSADRESVEVGLDAIAYDIEKIVAVLSIHNADERQQSFSLAKDIYIRVVNPETGMELLRYKVEETLAESNTIIMADVLRDGLGWKFVARGETDNGGLYKIAHKLHVNVAPV